MEVTRGDLALIRKAIREGWPVSRKVRRQVMHLVIGKGLDGSPRLSCAAVRTVLVANQANLDAARQRLYDLDAPYRPPGPRSGATATQ